ncbi:hypothetical protein EDB84DRAFT_1559277 [Lactarius hengduanensis]|nr:hypothetical protein EDB84DRAFT_1559277 [Lactarius hengduanensis]
MSENDITGVLDKRSSGPEDRFGVHVVVELRPGGTTQDITKANQGECVYIVMAHSIARQIEM